MYKTQEHVMKREVPECWSHSIKIEETAKGIRVHVHVYGNDEEETIESALRTYEKTKARFIERGHPVAAMEAVPQ